MHISGVELQKDIGSLYTVVESIREKDNLSFARVIELLKKRKEESRITTVPLSIFRVRELGILEALTIYLKEENKLTYHHIAVMLNRDDRPIWMTYHNARKKFEGKLIGSDSILIPVSIFEDRRLGVLGVLVKYLRDELKLRNSEVAGLLNRDSRTVWSVYARVKSK